MMTYSFPCQDLSNAGKLRGMSKGGNSIVVNVLEAIFRELL